MRWLIIYKKHIEHLNSLALYHTDFDWIMTLDGKLVRNRSPTPAMFLMPLKFISTHFCQRVVWDKGVLPKEHNALWMSSSSSYLPPMCPGFDSRTRRHMWVAFVVGSLLCSVRFFFLRVLQFSPLLKTNISKFQFDLGYRQHLIMSPWLGWLR